MPTSRGFAPSSTTTATCFTSHTLPVPGVTVHGYAVTVTRHAYADTSLGRLLLRADGDAVTGLFFENHRHPPVAADLGTELPLEDDELLTLTANELREYLAGSRRDFSVALRADGDAFSARVWQRLRAIPYGSTVTYGELARELGNAHLSQRVGQAVGQNPLCVLIPCHRVVGSDGSLTGYAGGLDRKRALLALEEPPAELTDRLF